ncbi:Glycosyl transferases group 1 [Acididesulfobacillus acetoxydans]|uniref:Glycosyl transferases group 1 n=1 Tax=Acididesulfobacillus acetoxydans TaxID=1561005 RepID=A0A8S0XAS8_9FIRM|nr:glycosyltransferase [Acididesulfobacillus acetoxydans]CAA7600326.1 Glycosyl transferases group 1 [Acididesulfobacillus acetoxydans]CEJ06102.1 Glycosyl transferases group 1 [Acididesulfobacillus acetoxydans]
MKILFLNDAPLIAYGLISGLAPGDEFRFLPVRHPDWEDRLRTLLFSWRPDFAFADGVSISTVAGRLFSELKSRGLPLVYWAIDDPPDFFNMSLPLARGAALTLTPAEECLAHYRRHRLNALFFHFACNPSFHRPVAPSCRYEADFLLVGNYYTSYPERKTGLEILLTPLHPAFYTLKVYGTEQWLTNSDHYRLPGGVYQGYLPYSELPAAYSSARIVLGINSVVDSPTMMSMRVFEALGCGAFCLTHHSLALERYFRNHEHLVWSRCPDETLELARYYLARPDLRQKIARQGQAEVYRLHTYTQRVESVRKSLEHL